MAAAPPRVAASSLDGTETILLVEDEEQVMRLGKRILEKRGYRVLAACTPAAAYDLASSHSGTIHLLLTDVVMPGMNGKELRKRLIAVRPEMKCLFMSGYTADIIAHHGVLDEGVEFVGKPFTSEALAQKVRALLSGKPSDDS